MKLLEIINSHMSIATIFIKTYQAVEPFKRRILLTVFGFTTECKHSPTCSEYAEKQIEQRGTIVGSAKAVWRILTCW